MNQSFDSENFIKIFYKENRKGFYIERAYNIFKPIRSITNSIVQVKINFKNNRYSTVDLQKKANRVKDKFKKRKYKKLQGIFNNLEQKIETNNIAFKLKKHIKIEGKLIYTVEKNRESPEVFFALKQVQNNIKKSFKVGQSDRYEVANQVINMLDNNFPKFVIRTDIKSFFETISHEKLHEKINKNYILNTESKKIINEILDQYKILSTSDKGIPRGVGISSYLAELYMQDIDNKIRALPNLTYYARYVDDIVAIFTPNSRYDKVCYLKQFKKIIEDEKLQLNEDKTKRLKLYDKDNQPIKLDFLGYKISNNNGSKLQVSITQSKLKKYKNKIDSAIEDYNKTNKYNEKLARKLLKNRLKYLTGNTRLLNAKKDIFLGIYFSNILVTKTNQLKRLDCYLQHKLTLLKPHEKLAISTKDLKNKFGKYSFFKGFKNRKFYIFNKNTLEDILKIWQKKYDKVNEK